MMKCCIFWILNDFNLADFEDKVYNPDMKIAIIGGGAAGMMAAATIAESGSDAKVFLIEKNKSYGKKVLISGGGRCNLTTGFSDLRLIAERYARGGKFLLSSLHAFSPEAVREWFEKHGVPTKVEEDLRVFPKSDDGKTVLMAFERIFKEHGVGQFLFHEITDIKKVGKSFQLHFSGYPPLTVDKVILTTGGQAYRYTGSTGEGYSFAEKLGHKITALAPSLSSLIIEETWIHNLAGVSLPSVAMKVKGENVSGEKNSSLKKYDTTGPILFTHKGLTGPGVFALSACIAFEKADPKNPLALFLDLLPNFSHAILEEEIKKEIKENPKKLFRNTLGLLLPKSLASELCTRIPITIGEAISTEKPNNEISKKEIAKTVELIKAIPLHIIGRAPGDEFVTAGGVELSEVNPQTLESKICPGLYFAGEILNIDGFTGGYNLQAAWATGRRAGENAVIE